MQGYLRWRGGETNWVTYALLLVSLDDGEVPGVRGGLHDEPAERLLVLGVDAGRLDQLGLELVDAVGLVVGVQVYGDYVDHVGRLVISLFLGCSVVRLLECVSARVCVYVCVYVFGGG